MKIRTAVNRSIALAVMASFAAPIAALVIPFPAYAYSSSDRYYQREEIEQLTAPIALYSDPLLAQILSAAAYPEEIAQAHRYAQGRRDYGDLDRQDWDPSVRALARYPEILDFLARDLEWTEALGIANINQPDDVADAIQRWRLQAYDLGSLRTGPEQIVYVDSGYVRIVPAQQDYFNVPRYNPQVIYVTRYVAGSAPFIFFGPRYIYGSWFDKDWDWRRRRIYYCDRDHWRNGRPVFHPQFDRVYVDRNRQWEPDHRRFKPPEKPQVPPHLTRTKVPSPPPDFKPGVRRDNHPPQSRPDDRRDQPGASPDKVIRRDSGDDKPKATPTRRVDQPESRKVEPPKPVEPARRSEQTKPAHVEPPKPAEQPKPQPQRQAPRRDDDEQQRGPRR